MGDEAYSLVFSGRVEARTIIGETELVVSLSGTELPKEPEAKQMALNLVKAAAAKLR